MTTEVSSTPLERSRRVAFITGAGRGIGRAIALRLAADGLAIAVNDLNESDAASVVEEIRALGGDSRSYIGNVAEPAVISGLVETAQRELGSVDVIVANAGIAAVGPILEATEEQANRIWQINVAGVLWTMKAGAEAMIRQGGGGKVIVASSIAGRSGSRFMSLYSASKHAVLGLVQSAAREWAEHGITVNAYCPGIVDTHMWEEIDSRFAHYLNLRPGEHKNNQLGRIALGRFQQAEDVAGTVAFLASPDSDYVTGQAITTDGGILFQ